MMVRENFLREKGFELWAEARADVERSLGSQKKNKADVTEKSFKEEN